MSKSKRNFKKLNRFDSASSELITQTRCDFGRMDSSWVKDPNTGFVHFSAYTARPGIYKYHQRMDDGSIKTVRELVTKKVLHSPKVLKSLNSKAVLNEHHFDQDGQGVMVRTDNAKDLMLGFTKDTHRIAEDRERTRIDGVITDDSLIADIEAGKQQTSPGYAVTIDPTGGVHPEYGRYDQEQVDRDYNHFSFTWRGRGGEGIRLDSDTDESYKRFDAWQAEDDTLNNEQEPDNMVKINIDGHEVEVSESAKIAYEAEKTRVDSEIQELKTGLESVKGEKEKTQGRVDALEIELKEANQFRVDSQFNELKQEAAPLLKDDFKFDGLDSIAVKKAVINEKYPEKKLDDLSAERLDGMYEMILEAVDKTVKPATRTDSFKKAETIYQNAERADAYKESETAYNTMIQKKQNQWKAGK